MKLITPYAFIDTSEPVIAALDEALINLVAY